MLPPSELPESVHAIESGVVMARSPKQPVPPTLERMRAAHTAQKRRRTLSGFRKALLSVIAELGPDFAQAGVILERHNETADTPTTLAVLMLTLKSLEAGGYVISSKRPSLVRTSHAATFYALTDKYDPKAGRENR